jgi:putative transcriptional regulator
MLTWLKDNLLVVARNTTGAGLTVFTLLWLLPYAINAADQDSFLVNHPMHNPDLAAGVLLIAGKKLNDPNFEKTVVLITAFDSQGTTGLIINRRTKIPVAEVLPKLHKLIPLIEHLYAGGPVAANSINLLIKSDTSLAAAKQVTNGIYLINTLEQFNQLVLENIEPGNLKLFSGLAGWAPGQLESELIRGDWYLWHTSTETVFNTMPENIWYELIQIVTAKWVKMRGYERWTGYY